MKALKLVPDVWRRSCVKRHIGLLSLQRLDGNNEDDESFNCSYILLCLTMEDPGFQLDALRKERGQ